MNVQVNAAYLCPNCGKNINKQSLACDACGAVFEGQAWRPLSPVDQYLAENIPPGLFYKFSVVLGLTFLICTTLPVGAYITQIVLGGILKPAFFRTAPATYYLFMLGMSYVPVALVIGFFLSKFSIFQRVPHSHRSPRLFVISTGLILFYLAARVFASTVPGGGGSFAVMSMSPLVVWPALIMLVIASGKLLIGVGKGNVPPEFQPTVLDKD